MAFPSSLLSYTVEAALGADLTGAASDWVWTDVSAYVRAVPIRITHGGFNGSTEIPPSTMTLTVDNRDGRWCEYNPNGAWFGQIRRGTPIRVKVNEGSTSVRMTAFIVALPPRWDVSGNDSTVTVTAAGITRQLQRGKVFRSPIYRAINTSAPVSYWPCEDGSSATSLAENSGGTAMSVRGTVSLSNEGPNGSLPLPEVGTDGWLSGRVRGYNPTGAWSVGVLTRIPTAVVASATVLQWSTSGSLPLWQIVLSPGSPDTLNLAAYDTAGVQQINTGIQFTFNTAEPYGEWLFIWATCSQSGTSVNYQMYADINSGGAIGGVTGSVTATAGVVTRTGGKPSTDLNGAIFGHFAVWDRVIDTVTDFASYLYLSGYTGEDGASRLLRLGNEAGNPSILVDDFGIAVTMGPQPTAQFLAVAREVGSVTDGRLFDERDPTVFNNALRFRSAGDFIHRDTDLALNYSNGQLAPQFEPTSDDVYLRNDWTVSRTDGSFANVVATDSSLSPSEVGTYADSATVNVDTDAKLVDQAGWRSHLGTVEGLRFPKISLNFARSPELIADWIGCEIGYRVTLSNPPAGIAADSVDVLIEGWAETISPEVWTVDLFCSPYKPYRVGIVANTSGDTDPLLGRMACDYDAAIRAAINSSALSVTVDPNRYRFTTVADDLDPDLKIRLGGEVVEVSGVATTAATYVAIGAASHADNAAVTPALFAGGVANDWILVLARIRGTAGTLATPTGYQVVKQVGKLYLFGKIHSGSESNPTVTPSGGASGDTVSAVTFGLRGMPITLDTLADAVVAQQSQSNASAVNIAYPGIYPKYQEGCVLLLLAGNSDDWTSVAQPSGWTEILDNSTTVGNDQGLYIAYQIQTTPAVANDGSLVVTGGASAVSESMAIALVGGYQTFTISNRHVNGVTKSHSAGTRIEVEDALVLTL